MKIDNSDFIKLLAFYKQRIKEKPLNISSESWEKKNEYWLLCRIDEIKNFCSLKEFRELANKEKI